MKDLSKIIILAAFLIIVTPLAAAAVAEGMAADSVPSETDSTDYSERVIYRVTGDDSFKVLCEKTGQVITVSAEEYIIGAVMAEMPCDYPEEALKAQAVAASTYAVRRREEQLAAPDPELKGAYISDDPEKYQGFFTEEQARLFYGEGYDEAYKKIFSAVNSVSDTILIYEGEPIVAAFHSMSAGTTENAENIWGTAVPYLIPAESEYDISAPDGTLTCEYTLTELSARLYAAYPDKFSYEDKDTLTVDITEKSSSGTVLAVSVGDISLTGQDIRRIFSLPSACFDIAYSDNKAVMTCYGKGHGVGMSQYGAKALAEKGYTYDQILMHYYKGVGFAEISYNKSKKQQNIY